MVDNAEEPQSPRARAIELEKQPQQLTEKCRVPDDATAAALNFDSTKPRFSHSHSTLYTWHCTPSPPQSDNPPLRVSLDVTNKRAQSQLKIDHSNPDNSSSIIPSICLSPCPRLAGRGSAVVHQPISHQLLLSDWMKLAKPCVALSRLLEHSPHNATVSRTSLPHLHPVLVMPITIALSPPSPPLRPKTPNHPTLR